MLSWIRGCALRVRLRDGVPTPAASRCFSTFQRTAGYFHVVTSIGMAGVWRVGGFCTLHTYIYTELVAELRFVKHMVES